MYQIISKHMLIHLVTIFFSIETSVLFYKMYEIKVNSNKKFNVLQNVKSDKYIKTSLDMNIKIGNNIYIYILIIKCKC